MRDALAERLLFKKVLYEWDYEKISKERPLLQAMAAFKYDGYQQFAPGMKFIESFALWLGQFDIEERRIAYDFIRNRLIFISNAEIMHLVSIAYSDHIKPILIERAASKVGYPEFKISKIVQSEEFNILRLQSLFLGLSDGARIDVFRRFSKELSHEQIWPIYDISIDRAKKMKEKLEEGLSKYLEGGELEEACKFRAIFLLDDFSGSGISYLRKEDGEYKGKIYRFYQKFGSGGNLSSFICDDAMVHVILYMATDKAKRYIEKMMDELLGNDWEYSVKVIQHIDDEYRVGNRDLDEDFIKNLVSNDKYYDERIQDEHTELGGTKDLKFGFADCALPLILHHNTPNNSIALLWSYDDEKYRVRGLFPRAKRHGVER